MKRTILCLMLTLGLAITALISLQREPASARSLTARPPATEMFDPLKHINDKARAAKSGDPLAVRALADEILDVRGLGIPETVLNDMKDRLTRAELDHQTKGKQKAIDEIDVVKMVNSLAEKLELPDYAKTNTWQVRSLRMGVWPSLPDFIRQEDARERAKLKVQVGLRATSKMSPLEAAYIAALMLQQKATNPAYQIAPREERQFAYNLKLSEWTAHQNGKAKDSASPPELAPLNNPKADQMREAVSKGLAALPWAEQQSLSDNLLDTLGIQR